MKKIAFLGIVVFMASLGGCVAHDRQQPHMMMERPSYADAHRAQARPDNRHDDRRSTQSRHYDDRSRQYGDRKDQYDDRRR